MRIRAVIAGVVVVGMLSAPLRGQSESPAFEVASVKANRSGDQRRGIGILPSGRFSAENVTLRDLVAAAYGQPILLYPFQIVGGPDWSDSDRFDIVAKWEGDASGSPPSPERISLMMRKLLADRFKLKARQETREGPIYVLALARSDGKLGPRLRRSEIDCPQFNPATPGPPPAAPNKECAYNVGYGRLTGRGVPVSRLALSLANFYGIGRLVVDRTGLTGSFDMDMEWAPLLAFRQAGTLDPPPGVADRPADPGPTIFTALQEQFGLKLDSQKGPVAVVVIDSAEKPAED